MSSTRVRFSRALFGILALAVVSAAGASIYQITRNRPKATPAPALLSATNAPAPRVGAQAPVTTVTPDVRTVTPDPKAAEVKPTPAKSPPAAATRPAEARRPEPAALPARTAGSALADGKAKFDAGDLLAARTILNDALANNRLSAADVAAARQLLSQANQTLIFAPKRLADDPLAVGYAVQNGEVLVRIASKFAVTPDFLLRINNLADARRLRAGQTIKVVRGPFHAVVNKSRFAMDVYLNAPGGPGSVYVTTLPVGLGKDDSTPTGTWQCEPGKKLKNPRYYPSESAVARGETIRDPGDPKNPLGKFWIGLAGIDGNAEGKVGYGIHGTIEPGSIGKQESLGCIRLGDDDITLVYAMLLDGKSTVVVKE